MVALKYSLLEEASPGEIEKGKHTAFQSVFGGGGYTADLNSREMEWYKAYLEEYTYGQNYNRALVEQNRRIEQEVIAREAQKTKTITTPLPTQNLTPVIQPSITESKPSSSYPLVPQPKSSLDNPTPSADFFLTKPQQMETNYQAPTSSNPLGLPEGSSAPKEFYEETPQPVNDAFVTKPAPNSDYYLGIDEPVEERGRIVTLPGETTPITIPSYELYSDTLTGAAKEASFVGVLPTKPKTLGIYTPGAFEADYAESRLARDMFAFQDNPLSFKEKPGFSETVTGFSTAEGEMTITSYGLGEDYFKGTYTDYLKEARSEYKNAPYAMQVSGNLGEVGGFLPKMAIEGIEFFPTVYKTVGMNALKLGANTLNFYLTGTKSKTNYEIYPFELGGWYGEVKDTPGKQATADPWTKEWVGEAILERPQTTFPVYGMVAGGAVGVGSFSETLKVAGGWKSLDAWNVAAGESLNTATNILFPFKTTKTGIVKLEPTKRNPFTQIDKGSELISKKVGTINDAPAYTSSGEASFFQTGMYDYEIIKPRLFGKTELKIGSIDASTLSKVKLQEGNLFVTIPEGEGFKLYGFGKREILSSTTEPLAINKYTVGSRPVTTRTIESFKGGGEGLMYDLGEKEISKSISTFYSKPLEKFTIKGDITKEGYTTLFHGTTKDSATNALKTGLKPAKDVGISRGLPIQLEEVYATPELARAEGWAGRAFIGKGKPSGGGPAVLKVEMPNNIFKESLVRRGFEKGGGKEVALKGIEKGYLSGYKTDKILIQEGKAFGEGFRGAPRR